MANSGAALPSVDPNLTLVSVQYSILSDYKQKQLRHAEATKTWEMEKIRLFTHLW